MQRLPVTVAVSFESERSWHWTCTRDLGRYFFPDGSFDVRRFFRENPCLTDPGSYAQDAPIDPECGWSLRWYGNVGNIERLRPGWETEIGYKSTLPASSIFFVEGGAYVFRHTESGKSERMYLDRRGSRSGAVRILLGCMENEPITVHAYPSKAFREDFIRNMFEHVERIFPGSTEDPLGSAKERRKGRQILPDHIRAILSEFAAVWPKARRIDQITHVRLDQFDAIEHRITSETEYALMNQSDEPGNSRGEPWQKIPVEIGSYEHSTPENEHLLHLFEAVHEVEKCSETESVMRIWRKFRIRPAEHSPLPRKLLQNRNAKALIDYVRHIGQCQAPVSNGTETYRRTGIERTNQLFEHYALIRLAESLERIGTVFPHGYWRGLYDPEKRHILECGSDESQLGWRLEWFYEWNLVRLSYVPRFQGDGSHAVLSSQAESLKHFSSAFSATGQDGLTPDYAIEWNGKLIILDAKFSAFREMDERFDYPCPEYVTEDLQKYRKIGSMENGTFIPQQAPIFLIYPWSVEDERDLATLRQWNEMLYASYRICLMPFGNHSEAVAKGLHAYLDGLLSGAMHENGAPHQQHGQR